MAKVYVGTSGYSYQDWKGPFYPPASESGNFLTMYARSFSFVELNFSYYKMPEPFILERMAGKTGNRFFFTIKAHRSLTHERTDAVEEDIQTFKSGIKPLIEARKLAAVLVQFPYSFHYNPRNRRVLDSISTHLSELPLAIEFRGSDWQKDQVYEEFERRNICYVNVDHPNLPKLMKPDSIVTSDLAYIRFHGRNRGNWWTGDNISRYDYLYSDDELKGWIKRIKEMVKKAKELLITFNNHPRGQAVKNAFTMKELLTASGIGEIH